MQPSNPYAPPSADPGTGESVAPARVPLLFTILLVAFFVVTTLTSIAAGQIGAIGWLLVMSIAAWRTLQGGQAASRFLAAMLAVNVAFMALVLWAATGKDAGFVAVAGVIIAWMLALIGYIFMSPSLKALFAAKNRAKWQA